MRLGLVLVSALLLVAGCSSQEADIPGIESGIEEWAAKQDIGRVSVDCPDSIEWKTGSDFHCVMTDKQGSSARVTVTMENDDGDVTWVMD